MKTLPNTLMETLKGTLMETLINVLTKMTDVFFKNRSDPDWSDAIRRTICYTIPKTAPNSSLHFNPRARCILDSLSTEWYRVTDSGPYSCTIDFQNEIKDFRVDLGDETLFAMNHRPTESRPDRGPRGPDREPDREPVLACVINGSPGSLFRYHYPLGIDVTPILGPVFDALIANVNLQEIMPALLVLSVGEQIKYEKSSLSLTVLYDGTFEELCFSC